jgi:hypothetical protein
MIQYEINDVGLGCGLYHIMNQRVNCYENSYMVCSLQIEAELGWIVWVTLGNISEYHNFLTKVIIAN